jgi:hypothetical protein
MNFNEELNKLFKGVDLSKLSKTELLVLNSKLKIMHEALKGQIIEKLDEEEKIFNKSIEILSMINSRL